MKHKDKLKLARRMSGKAKNVFISPEWETRKRTRAERAKRKSKKRMDLAPSK